MAVDRETRVTQPWEYQIVSSHMHVLVFYAMVNIVQGAFLMSMQYLRLQQGRDIHNWLTAWVHGDAHRALYKEVQGEDAYPCRQEAPPKD